MLLPEKCLSLRSSSRVGAFRPRSYLDNTIGSAMSNATPLAEVFTDLELALESVVVRPALLPELLELTVPQDSVSSRCLTGRTTKRCFPRDCTDDSSDGKNGETGLSRTFVWGLGLQRPMTCSKADKRTFHQGPRVKTLNFEAGYVHAVFPHATQRRILAARAGSIYAP